MGEGFKEIQCGTDEGIGNRGHYDGESARR